MSEKGQKSGIGYTTWKNKGDWKVNQLELYANKFSPPPPNLTSEYAPGKLLFIMYINKFRLVYGMRLFPNTLTLRFSGFAVSGVTYVEH